MHVATLEVFDKLGLQYLSVGHFADAHRHRLLLSHRRAAIPALSENNLKAPLRAGPNQQRLQHAVFADAGGEFLHRIFVESLTRVGRRYNQPIERQVAVLGLNLNCSSHGKSPVPVESSVRAQAGTLPSAPAQDVCVKPLRTARAPSPPPRFLPRG